MYGEGGKFGRTTKKKQEKNEKRKLTKRFGVPEKGDKVEDKKAEGQFMAEGGSGKSASGSWYKISPYLLGQEAGDSGEMGGLVAYL